MVQQQVALPDIIFGGNSLARMAQIGAVHGQ